MPAAGFTEVLEAVAWGLLVANGVLLLVMVVLALVYLLGKR